MWLANDRSFMPENVGLSQITLKEKQVRSTPAIGVHTQAVGLYIDIYLQVGPIRPTSVHRT